MASYGLNRVHWMRRTPGRDARSILGLGKKVHRPGFTQGFYISQF
jgi:hypothetical protein